MPVLNGKTEKNSFKKQRRWSLIGILSKKKKLKKSQESMDFCPYDGKINQKVAQNNHLDRSTDCLIEQYTCSPRLIRRCNSLQYPSQLSTYSNTASQPTLNEWKLSQQSVYSSSSSACYSDIGVYKSCRNSNRSSYYIKEEHEQTSPVSKNLPFRCSSEIGHYSNKINDNQRFLTSSVVPKKLIGKKIPPPPPPRDPNVKAVYYFRNNRLMSRESDSTYFSQGSDDDSVDKGKIYENEIECQNEYYLKEPPRSRRPIQICDVETLSTESENSEPRIQSVEEALQELEDIYNSLGLSDEDLLDRAERRDLPTLHQNMRYQSFDELDCATTVKKVLPKTRRSGIPDIISDDMAYRRLNKKESKRQCFVPLGSFLLVLPTVHNVDKSPKPSGEPDITLDDVVFRSRRQHLNFLKIPDPQPPFGIPLGPIVGAAPSDYLHAVPEGRYKPSFHPRKMPDTVEDDLAFRTLRKDNKYKTCIDFAFICRNQLKINSLIPGLYDNNRIKHDTHWILKKKTSAGSCRNNKNRMTFAYDDMVGSIAVADDRQNLVVKINHHKPILLTEFAFNQLSKSFICTNLLQHEPRKNMLCLTNNDTAHIMPNCNDSSAPWPQADCFLRQYSLNESNARILSVNNDTPEKEKRRTDNVVRRFNADYLKNQSKKNQPNFRALIKREYYVRGYPLVKNQLDADIVLQNDGCDHPHVTATAACDRQALDGIKSRFVNDDDDNTSDVAAGTLGQWRDVPTTCSDDPSMAAAGSCEDCSPSTGDDRNGVPPTDYLNRGLPGYMEVCLYITIYIYQLFSVNAYSTFMALIFLIALHLCRRLS